MTRRFCARPTSDTSLRKVGFHGVDRQRTCNRGCVVNTRLDTLCDSLRTQIDTYMGRTMIRGGIADIRTLGELGDGADGADWSSNEG